MQTAEQIIEKLDLSPHPEGGFFRETQRIESKLGQRSLSTSIYFLLQRGQASHWHRIDACETWHFYAGSPLELLSSSSEQGPIETRFLGPDLHSGQQPQLVIQAHEWQAAKTLGDYTLVGCTVSPGFEFSKFELAPPDWQPGKSITDA